MTRPRLRSYTEQRSNNLCPNETNNKQIKHQKQARNVPYKVPGGGDPFSREYDNCIVGAGISGSVIAERYASIYGQTSLIIEKRHHIGGNMFDYVDEDTGIRVRWVFYYCV